MTDEEKQDLFVEVVNLVMDHMGAEKAQTIYDKLFDGGMHAFGNGEKTLPDLLGMHTHVTLDPYKETSAADKFEEAKQEMSWTAFHNTYPEVSWQQITDLYKTLGKPQSASLTHPTGNIITWIKALRELAPKQKVMGSDGSVYNGSTMGLKDAKFFVNWLMANPVIQPMKIDKQGDSAKKFAEEYLTMPSGSWGDMTWKEFSATYPKFNWKDVQDITQLLGKPGTFNIISWHQFLKDKAAGAYGYTVLNDHAVGFTKWLKQHPEALEYLTQPGGATTPKDKIKEALVNPFLHLPKGSSVWVDEPHKHFYTHFTKVNTAPIKTPDGMLAWWDFKTKYPMVEWAQIRGLAKEIGDPLSKKVLWIKRVRLLGLPKSNTVAKGYKKVIPSPISLTDARDFVAWLIEYHHYLGDEAEPYNSEWVPEATPTKVTLTTGITPKLGDLLEMHGQQMLVVAVVPPNEVSVIPANQKPFGVTNEEYAQYINGKHGSGKVEALDVFKDLMQKGIDKTFLFGSLYGSGKGGNSVFTTIKSKKGKDGDNGKYYIDTEMSFNDDLVKKMMENDAKIEQDKMQEDLAASEQKIKATPEPKVVPLTDLLEQMKKDGNCN